MSMWMQVGFSDPKSSNAKNLILYHDMTMVVVVVVLVIVGGFLLIFICKGLFLKNLTARFCYGNNKVEAFWSSAPAVFLVVLGYFSLRALYSHEVGEGVDHLVKAVAHQWYWEYEYSVNMNSVESKLQLECWLSTELEKAVEVEKFSVLNSNVGVEGSVGMVSWLFNVMADFMEMAFWLVGTLSLFFAWELNELSSGNEVMVSDGGFYAEGGMVDLSGSEGSDSSDLVERKQAISSLTLVAETSGELMLGGDLKVEGYNEVPDSEVLKFAGLNVFNLNKVVSNLSCGMFFLFLYGDWHLIQESFYTTEMVPGEGGLRHLDVSDPCYFVRSVKNELSLITADVMHAWGVPELGVKVDAVPGRSNSIGVVPFESAVVHGNCYELCGVGHSQMPIVVVILDKESFSWAVKDMVVNSDEALEAGVVNFNSWL